MRGYSFDFFLVSTDTTKATLTATLFFGAGLLSRLSSFMCLPRRLGSSSGGLGYRLMASKQAGKQAGKHSSRAGRQAGQDGLKPVAIAGGHRSAACLPACRPARQLASHASRRAVLASRHRQAENTCSQSGKREANMYIIQNQDGKYMTRMPRELGQPDITGWTEHRARALLVGSYARALQYAAPYRATGARVISE